MPALLRSLGLALLLLRFSPIVAQPPAAEVNRTDAQGRKQGAWTKTWPNGKTRYMGQFTDDRPQGLFRHYSEEGALTTEQTFAPDGTDSRAVHYHPNGQVMARGNYHGQRKDSTWNYFDEEGHAKSIERYADGQLEGERIVYYRDGKPAEVTTWRQGVQHGPWKQYFPSGTVKAQAEFVNGEPEGTMTWFHPNGKKEIEGKAVNGARDGVWIYFNEDGSIQLTMAYAQGDLVNTRYMNGTFKTYYDDDQLKEEVTYRDGKKNGPFKEYHANGHLVTRTVAGDPQLGIPAEDEKVWEGQVVARSGTYKNDRLDGEVKTMAENGTVVKTEVYANGEPIRSTP